jgi:hypothetical protein
MRSALVFPALLLAAACSGGPTEQEQNLSERGEAPEQVANGGTGNITPGTAPATEQGKLGDTMPEEPTGPSSDRGSGAGGDTVPSQ